MPSKPRSRTRAIKSELLREVFSSADPAQSSALANVSQEVLEMVLPVTVQFLVRRMRTLGIVPIFYAGAAYNQVTGAHTAGYDCKAAVNQLAHELESRWKLSRECTTGIAQAVADHLADLDKLPPDVAHVVARTINQGDIMLGAMAQTILQNKGEHLTDRNGLGRSESDDCPQPVVG